MSGAGPGAVVAFAFIAASTFFSLSLAQPWTVETEHVRVVYEDAALEDMALRVAALAEEAVGIVAGWFESEPFPVTLTLDGSTDTFNAIASALPRPTVAVRFVPPVESALGLGADDWLELLIVHELAHLAHFTRTTAPGVGLGLVGEGVAPPPPLWLVEGLATWLESELTRGGRRDDALTAGVLATLSRSENWPTLAEVGSGTEESWPGGRARYLLGATFLDALVRDHGWSTVLAAIETFNLAPPWQTFAAVWESTTGDDLYAAWEAFRDEVAQRARVRTAGLPSAPTVLTDTGHTTGLPALSPSGDRLAWRTWPSGIAVAPLQRTDEGETRLGASTTYLAGAHVQSLDWLDEDRLVSTRTVPTSGTRFADVFVLDLATGHESRWTVGERAHFVRGTGEPSCASWIRIVPGRPAAVVERCGAETPRVLWEAPDRAEIVGFDRAPGDRAVVSVWDRGMVGLAVLEPAAESLDAGGAPSLEPRWLTWDRHLDLDPVWTAQGTIRFRSDRTERFEIWEIDPGDGILSRWTDTLGGAFQPAAAHAMVLLGSDGFDLAAVPATPREVGVRPEPTPPDVLAAGEKSGVREDHVSGEDRGVGDDPGAAIQPYDPWSTLAPFGWWPTALNVGVTPLRLAAEVAILGQDATARHAWTGTLGLDTGLEGPLGPAYASGRYTWGPTGPFTSWTSPPSTSWWVQAGLWPHEPHLAPRREIASGVRGGGVLRYRDPSRAAALRFQVGVVHVPSLAPWWLDARVDAVASDAGGDRWGYAEPGVRLGVSARWTPSPGGVSAGAWVDGELRLAALDGMFAGTVRAGYRQPPPVPLALDAWAVVAGIEGRWHTPLEWRYGDGRYALERVTWTPAVRAWWDAAGIGVGADLTIGADLLVSYGVPATAFVQGGWSQGPWWNVGVGIPF